MDKCIYIFVYDNSLIKQFKDGALQYDRRVYPGVPVASSISEIQWLVLRELYTGDLLGRLVLSGHGWGWTGYNDEGGFQMGSEILDKHSVSLFIGHMQLIKQKFSPAAVIQFMGCLFGHNIDLMSNIATKLGVRVQAARRVLYAGRMNFHHGVPVTECRPDGTIIYTNSHTDH